jgi:hypothetical protein
MEFFLLVCMYFHLEIPLKYCNSLAQCYWVSGLHVFYLGLVSLFSVNVLLCLFLSSGKELLWVVIVGWSDGRIVGWSVFGSMWQYADWSMGFMCWFLIGPNKFPLQTSADARVAPGSCTVQYKQLIISVQRLE